MDIYSFLTFKFVIEKEPQHRSN